MNGRALLRRKERGREERSVISARRATVANAISCCNLNISLQTCVCVCFVQRKIAHGYSLLSKTGHVSQKKLLSFVFGGLRQNWVSILGWLPW